MRRGFLPREDVMTEPVAVDLPHRLCKAAARGRIEHGVGKIANFVPGGALTERHWEGDVMPFTVQAVGPGIARRPDVPDPHVQERKSVAEGKGVSVRVELGGRRFIKKK